MPVTKHWMKRIGILLKRILSNILIIMLLFFAVTMAIPYFLGLNQYAVLSDSMNNTITFGSLVYVEKKPFEEMKPLDIATFKSLKNPHKSFTHRIISMDKVKKTFVTKWDANPSYDPVPASARQLVGKVTAIIPFAGMPAALFANFSTMVIALLLLASWIATEIEMYIRKRKKRDDAV